MTCRSDVSFGKSAPNDRKGLIPVIRCTWRELPDRPFRDGPTDSRIAGIRGVLAE